jgi:hypothetical protein
MGLTNPYRQKHYQGEYATETGTGSVLAWIRANKWDSAGDGTGDPQEGMCFYDTAVDRVKVFTNAVWKGLAYTTDAAGAGGSDHQIQFNDGGTVNGAATLYWDHVTSRVGLGTSTPTVDFDVVTESAGARGIKQRNYSATADAPAVLALHRARGTAASPADINTGDTLGLISISGRSAGADYVGAQIGVVADGTTAKKTHVTISTLNGTTFAECVRFTGDGVVVVGKVGGATGQIDLAGTTSGVVSLKVADAAGTWTMRLPLDDGAPGQFLKTDGSGGCDWDDLPSSYIAQEFTAETTVVVAHNLGAYPIVQVIDGDKEVLIPQAIVHTSVDSLTVTFSVATSGTILVTLGAVDQTISKSFMISSPTADAHSPLWRVPVSITITHIHVLCIGGTNIVGQLWEYDANGANGATVDGDITAPAGTNTDDDGAISNPSIAAGNYLGWKTTSVSGTPTRVIVTFEYTES